jgi:hypothetical protein
VFDPDAVALMSEACHTVLQELGLVNREDASTAILILTDFYGGCDGG